MEHYKLHYLKKNNFKWSKKLPLNIRLIKFWNWWINTIQKNVPRSFKKSQIQFILEVDSSLQGWDSYLRKIPDKMLVHNDLQKVDPDSGCSTKDFDCETQIKDLGCETQIWQAYSRFSASHADLHINSKELLGIYFAIQSFQNFITDCSILIKYDNQTSISNFKKFGTMHSPFRDKVAFKIHSLLKNINCSAYITYISSQNNFRADFSSRNFENPNLEWTIDQITMRKLKKICPRMGFDLFSTNLNCHCSWV